MRFSCAFALLLALIFVFSSEGFRLKRTGGHSVTATHPDDAEDYFSEDGEEAEGDESEEQDAGEHSSIEEDADNEKEDSDEAGEERDVHISSFCDFAHCWGDNCLDPFCVGPCWCSAAR